MHGPRCFLQELHGHVHFCMGAYGEYSSRLRNFGGFKLVTNLTETKEAKCKLNHARARGHRNARARTLCTNQYCLGVYISCLCTVSSINGF